MNPTAQRQAYLQVKQRLQAAKALGISKDTTDDELKELAFKLAEQKASDTNTDPNDHVSGQYWYVTDIYAVVTNTIEDALKEAYRVVIADLPDAQDDQVEALVSLKEELGL
jgi:preprotein translocase subunit Sec63